MAEQDTASLQLQSADAKVHEWSMKGSPPPQRQPRCLGKKQWELDLCGGSSRTFTDHRLIRILHNMIFGFPLILTLGPRMPDPYV